MGKQGGPCNGGLAIIALIPPFLICIPLLFFSVKNFIDNSQKNLPIIGIAVSLSIWTFMLVSFANDDVKEALEYLGPFEILNVIIITVVIFKKRVQLI
jgi:hypothetical protein